ncbi:PLD nuclease N-terminal domain-containing protein [Christiangramia sp. SM2212]|uniref:PLD nuclease N-terminal domain-containing protein n=1 Tax=Christiangramia sediminicola TaxID=3073267 RepID=A0ABU1ERD4_9FLAO|nr:PLD nuclease N-terminal domain-containing protein [Christiangramia sp. SM2212]MDR5590931.1 PLD nuclease N-terminal domain-containing protein [Christiangramia sp. SM2212]
MQEFFLTLFKLLVLTFTVLMAIHAYKSDMSPTAKILWITGMFLAPLLGATLYYISDHGKY